MGSYFCPGPKEERESRGVASPPNTACGALLDAEDLGLEMDFDAELTRALDEPIHGIGVEAFEGREWCTRVTFEPALAARCANSKEM